MKNLYVGTSGIVIPVPQSQYPAQFKGKSRLTYYSSILNSVEINSSFYKNPRAATVAKWATEVGDDFRFTFKMSKAISHAKDLEFDAGDVASFISLVNAIGDKKACLLLQLPPRLMISSIEPLTSLLQNIQTNNPGASWKVAVEFRHPSWYVPEVEALLNKFTACRVIHDHPKCPVPLKMNGDFFYIRFHGENGRYRGSYAPGVLLEYASAIKDWIANGKQGYSYFNNTMGNAFDNARSLLQMVNG